MYFQQWEIPAELPPKTLIITDLEKTNTGWKCTWPATFTGNTIPRPYETFDEHNKTLQKWEQDLMREVEIVLDKEDLQNLLEESTPIYLVTDGGVKDNIGYYGW
eukprot:1357308-Ditylum_brightwellii.AAC.1